VNHRTVKWEIRLALAREGIGGFSQAARRLGISKSYLSHICSGRQRPARIQRAVARLCRRNVADLFGEFTSRHLSESEKG
jgi:DNA-binding transcriptional regulator YdaS (Cro superfamily)